MISKVVAKIFIFLMAVLKPTTTIEATISTTTQSTASKKTYQHGNGTIGTCSEFLKLNNLDACCAERDDECYMNHYDSRCYCDVFCNNKGNNHDDCCSDGAYECILDSSKKTLKWFFF